MSGPFSLKIDLSTPDTPQRLSSNCYICNPCMKNRRHILILSALLLMAISYVQVFLKISDDNGILVEVAANMNDDAEEGAEKTSTEEQNRETDSDEDPFKLNETILTASANSDDSSKNAYHSSGPATHYPEIVSPPPQA